MDEDGFDQLIQLFNEVEVYAEQKELEKAEPIAVAAHLRNWKANSVKESVLENSSVNHLKLCIYKKENHFMEDKKDIIRNSLIALSAAIPYVGGTLSFLLDKYIPSEAEKKRNEFIMSLANDLEEMKEKINVCNLETPEFYSIFTKLLKASMEEYRNEKLTAFRNLAINIVLEPQKFNKVDFFTQLVISLVPDEIMILRVFYLLDVKGELQSFDNNKEERDIFDIILKVYGINDRLYIQALLTDCQRYRLILASNEIHKKVGRDGLYLSDLGKDFLSYIFLPKDGEYNEFREK